MEYCPTSIRIPIQAWRLGDELTWIFLGGEVVVDYSLRLKGSSAEEDLGLELLERRHGLHSIPPRTRGGRLRRRARAIPLRSSISVEPGCGGIDRRRVHELVKDVQPPK